MVIEADTDVHHCLHHEDTSNTEFLLSISCIHSSKLNYAEEDETLNENNKSYSFSRTDYQQDVDSRLLSPEVVLFDWEEEALYGVGDTDGNGEGEIFVWEDAEEIRDGDTD